MYTVMIGAYGNAAATLDQFGAIDAAIRALSDALAASTTPSNCSSSTRQPPSTADTRSTRWRTRRSAPALRNQRSAGAGRASPKLTRGSNRSAEPRPLNRASFRTRRKT